MNNKYHVITGRFFVLIYWLYMYCVKRHNQHYLGYIATASAPVHVFLGFFFFFYRCCENISLSKPLATFPYSEQ